MAFHPPSYVPEDVLREALAHARDVAHAVQIAASAVGVAVGDWQARQIAKAARNFAEGGAVVQEAVAREMWEIEGYRNHVRREMRWKLLDEVTSQGYIPVDLPSEKLCYTKFGFGTDAGTEVPDSAHWDTVVVRLEVPTREPSVDRAAAVKAGILTGRDT